jgi:clan AA aspartic protease (TIGR02281 family)
MTAAARRAALVATVLVALPMAAHPQDAPPDVATIRERVRAAAGVLPAEWRQTTITTTSNETTSTVKRMQRGASWRELNDTPPFHSERGFANGQAWHQNDNGQTIADLADPGLATREATTTTVRAVHTPVEAYVIATLNAGGFGQKDYIDPATWRLVRRENLGVNGLIVTTYDDIREDGGRTFAHHWRTDNAYTHTIGDTKITAYDAGPVTESDVAMPPSRRRLVTFPAGVRSAELPVRFGRAHVVVRIVVAGRGLDFLLDTGASGIVIDETVARELGLPFHAQRSAVTAGRYTTARTVIPEMRVGELTMKDVATQIVPQGWNEAAGIKTVGLLGFDFLAELGVTIDYEKGRVTVVPEPAYAPPSDAHTIALDVRINTGQPLTTAAINGATGERFLLDTGGAGPLLVYDFFARRHPEALVDAHGGGARSQPLHLYGIGGEFETRPIQLASVKLGNVNFTDVIAHRIASKGSYASNTDAQIGPEFFKLFTLGLDYANNRVYLVPNADGRKAMGIRE